jgi:crossover junction endodeoxyribonuclease RuvC
MVQVTPSKWKKHFGLSSDKEQARGLAIQRFPLIAECLNRKKDADRAEALLIAQWYLETR